MTMLQAQLLLLIVSERVGINETNPEQDLHLTHNSTLYMRAENTTLGCVTDFGTSGVGSTIINRSAHPMKFLQILQNV